ncbi:MAG TPA: thymidine phosphorylase, partial [Polyangia bacterium]
EAAIASGAGGRRPRRCVELQGGDPRVIDDPGRLPRARHQIVVRAPRRGVVTRLDAGTLGRAATRLGAGRMRQEDRIDPGVGIVLHRKEGDPVDARDALCTVWFADPRRLAGVRAQIAESFTIEARRSSEGARGARLVLERIE